MSPRIKICGITNRADAEAAVAAGADALGFVFAPTSPRYLARETASALLASLPHRVLRVGVFVNSPPEALRQIAGDCGLDILQLHGEEPPAFCAALAPWPVWKAFRVRNRDVLNALPAYREPTAAWLLDSYVQGAAGGTGATFQWDLAVEARALGHPIVLAGGLTPDNVAAAVRQVRPAWVDVSSGVESAPGRKDHAKLAQFIAAARQPLPEP